MTIKRAICLLILCLFFSGVKLLSQTSSTISQLDILKNSHSIDSAYITLQNGTILSDFPIIRTIDGKHKQLIAKAVFSNKYYDILIQEDSLGVYLCVINEITGNKDNKSIKNVILKIDSARFHNFITVHDGIYKSNLSADLYRSFSVNRYGIACSFTGTPTEKFSEMMYILMRGNFAIPILDQWLKNYDYETKILGATGLLILQKKGFDLSPDDIAKIEHLRKLNLPINYCSGCTEWNPMASSRLLENRIISTLKDDFIPTKSSFRKHINTLD